MASSGAARPCLLHVLQAGRQINSSPFLSRRSILPIIPSYVTHMAIASYASVAAEPANGAPKPKPKPAPTKKVKGKPPRVRPNRDNNKQRGISAMRRTGPRRKLSVSPRVGYLNGPSEDLPRPLDEADFAEVKTNPKHGLWQFFYEHRNPLNTPAQDSEHGRAWKVDELRRKNWEDLHRLWWVCCKERNRISTGNWERAKLKYGYGIDESRGREIEVRKTMNAIKHVLTERYYAWEDAKEMAMNDPEKKWIFKEDGTVKCLEPPETNYAYWEERGYRSPREAEEPAEETVKEAMKA